MTSLDIRKQSFKKVFRGYDREEAKAFLEMVADEFERLNRENIEVRGRADNLEAEVTHFREMEETLKEMLKTAQQAAEDVRENARKEARLVVKEAEILANRAVEKARVQVQTIRSEIVDLKNQRDMFVARFQALVQAQADFLAQLEFTDADVIQEQLEEEPEYEDGDAEDRDQDQMAGVSLEDSEMEN
ncbi:MAG: DivIVA domain-containing protein [bacterium]|nr:DivIVA domain-containing protein [bacterium]